ncbi:hypothetical protein EMIT043CA1_110174 [Pseudomonas brassicacearum]
MPGRRTWRSSKADEEQMGEQACSHSKEYAVDGDIRRNRCKPR